MALSAISTFLKVCSNIDINKSDEVTRFMKGVFLHLIYLSDIKITNDQVFNVPRHLLKQSKAKGNIWS